MSRLSRYTPIKRAYVGTREAAAILGVHYLTLLRQIEEGKIPAIRVGKQWRILINDLIKKEEGIRGNSPQTAQDESKGDQGDLPPVRDF